MIRRPVAVLLCLIALCAAARGDTVWRDIRDGVVWVRTAEPTRIAVRWLPAWSASGHMETLYFQAPDGRLIERRRIGFKETEGSHDFHTGAAPGDYRLEIPGYSYRRYRVRIVGSAASVFEPVRVHCPMHVRGGEKLFFRVEGGTRFTLGGRFHGGAQRLGVLRGEEARGAVYLFDYEERFGYARHDKLPLDEPAGAMWSVTMDRDGKVSFWLDDTPNVFAQSPTDWFLPQRKPGRVSFAIGPEIPGPAPAIGSEVEFANLSDRLYDALSTLSMTSANHYVFQDAIESAPPGKETADVSWLRVYEDRMGIRDALHIFEPHREYTYRGVPPLSLLEGYRNFITDYLAVRRGKAGLAVRYTSFFDEPNSRFADYKHYEEYFVTLARAVRASEDPSVRSAAIAAPETAGFLNGPTKDDAERRIGAEWTKRLLADHADLFDAVAWHEWMTRDLIALDWFGESVAAARELVDATQPAGSPRKKLIIGQTNLSSGSDICAYEQDTFYAALWWGSAVAHAAHEGKLAMINWTPSLDDPRSAKGLIDDRGRLKPVGHAMRFINRAVLSETILCRSDSVEAPALATVDRKRNALSVFFVNKYARLQHVAARIALPDGMGGAPFDWRLDRLGDGPDLRTVASGRLEAAASLEWQREIDGPALYALRFSAFLGAK